MVLSDLFEELQGLGFSVSNQFSASYIWIFKGNPALIMDDEFTQISYDAYAEIVAKGSTALKCLILDSIEEPYKTLYRRKYEAWGYGGI